MKTAEIRKKFLDFFEDKQHKIVQSDSLIPSSDPSLLFTSAGMVQFKKNFLGQSRDSFKRAASCQKCFRTSDIEQVGYTTRHLTFFEMLGNFSFGDYFKGDAINWAWEFFTEVLKLPKEKLYPTIYKDDDEAFEIWKKIVPEDRITKMGEDSNFWNMGPTGPCGPCSEILIDLGEHMGCGKPTCGPSCDCDRYSEIWNLVFTQFDRQSDNSLKPLPKKNIDTGMGLERLAAVANKKNSVFETDVFDHLIKKISSLLDVDQEENFKQLSMIADHCRAVTFLISDGILPSNEGRGYVLRRILRRALRQGKIYGAKKPFIYKMIPEVANLMKDAYPELLERKENIASITKMEEQNFLETLESGMKIINEIIAKHKKTKKDTISGEEAFKLYDTYGFPMELTKEIASENSLKVDEEGFEKSRKAAQDKARSSWSGSGQKDIAYYAELFKETGKTEFVGYEKLQAESKILAIIKNKKKVSSLKKNDEGEIILGKTPFYAESGGQVADTGILENDNASADVLNVYKPVEGLIVHKIKVTKGEINRDNKLTAQVDIDKRLKTMAHHTATHILHKALRQILGTHVTQAGSLVTPDYFRFDFTHFSALKPEELSAVEEYVNNSIRQDMKVKISNMKLEQAKKTGAMALFGEKYADIVRVVSIVDQDNQPFSSELCGGTHTTFTGRIGLFKILSESSISSGTRRIEAVVGEAAEKHINTMERTLNDVCYKLKSSNSEILQRIDRILNEHKELEKQISKLKTRAATGEQSSNKISEIDGIKVLTSKVENFDVKSLRELSDNFKNKLGSGIVIVASSSDEKVSFIVSITKDIIEKGKNAGTIAKSFASLIGGSGGGKPDFAQGGGKDPQKIDSALNKITSQI